MKFESLATIGICDLEQVFLQKFIERLRDTESFENYAKILSKDDESTKVEDRQNNLQGLIKDLTERIDGIFLTLQSPGLEEDDREQFIDERNKLKRRRGALRNEEKIQSPLQVYMKYKDLMDRMAKYWEKYPFGDRQSFVVLLVKRVYLEPLSHHFMKLTIEWKEFPEDEGILWRRYAESFYWEPEEEEVLRSLYPTEPPDVILQALPRRTWASIAD